MADEPKDENSDSEAGQSARRSKWLDSLIDRLDDADGDAPAQEASPVDRDEEPMMLRSGEYLAMPDIGPPPTPAPPAIPSTAAPGHTDADEGLTFEIGDEIEDDAPYGVSELGELDQESGIELAEPDEHTPAPTPLTESLDPINLEFEPGEAPAQEPQPEPSPMLDAELELEPESMQPPPEPGSVTDLDPVDVELADALDDDDEMPTISRPGPLTDAMHDLQLMPDSEGADEFQEELPTVSRGGLIPTVTGEHELVASVEPSEADDDLIVEEQDDDSVPEEPALDLALRQAQEDDPQRMELTLQREIEAASDKPRKALLEHELGHLLQGRLDNEGRAAKAYAQALNLDPSLRPNVWAIARIFAQRELWTNLIKLYDAQIRFEQDDARRAEILLEKGWVLQDHLSDLAGARECFWVAYHANERWLAPLLALEHLDVVQGDLEDLAQVLRHMAETAEDPARRVAALTELARMQSQLSGGSERVALTLLDRARAEGVDPLAALELADRIAAEAGMHRERIEILKQQAELLAAMEPAQIVDSCARLREAARVALDALQDLECAQQLLEQAALQLPAEPLLQRDLLQVVEQRGDFEQLVGLLRARRDAETDPRQRAELGFSIGLAELGANSLDAGSTFDDLLAELPGYLPVVAAKERRLLATANLEGLAELYVAEAEAVQQRSAGLPLQEGEDADWAAGALWRAAALFHRYLERPDRAITLCRQCLALKPGFQPAVDQLELLLRQLGQYAELADLLQQQADSASPEQSIYLLESLAALCSAVLAQPERELDALLRLRQRSPGNRSVLRRVVHTARNLGRTELLGEVLLELEDGEPDPSLQLQWKLARADLTDDANPDQAEAIYREILEHDPTDPYAFPAMELLLRRRGQLDQLVLVLRQAVDHSLDPQRKCELLLRMAAVLQRLERNAELAAVHGELLDLRPDDPALLLMQVRSALDAGDFAGAAEAMERQAEQEPDPSARARILIRLAELLQDRLKESGRAEEMLRRAVEAAPGVADAVEALTWRQIARGDFMQAAENLDLLARQGPQEARNLMLEEQAWINCGPLGEADAGAHLWGEVLESDSRNLRGLLALQRLAARDRDAGALSALLARQADVVGEVQSEPQELRDQLELRAGLLADAAGDPDGGAADRFRRVLERDEGNIEALTALLARNGLPPEERANLTLRLAQTCPDRVREEMRIELAELLEISGRPAEAAAELVEILRRDGENLPALLVLQRLAQSAGNRELELRVWIRTANRLFNTTAKAEAFARAAELLNELQRPEDAAIIWRHVLALRPQDDQSFQQLTTIYRQQQDQVGLEQILGHRIKHTAPDQRGTLIGLHFERAELRMSIEDTAGAARDMGQVLRHDPLHLEALRQLARLYDEDNNPRRALQLYTRYLKAADARSLKRPAVLRVAQLLHQLHRTSDAVDVCRKFLDLSPGDEDVLDLLSGLYLEVHDFPRAIEILERLGELPDREADWKAENLQRMARVQWKDLQDVREARSTLLRAREVDPSNIEVVGDLRQLGQQMGIDDDLDRLLERSKDDLREVLATRPLDAELYRKLMRVAEWHEDTYTLLGAMGVLCFLDAAQEQDRELYQRRMKLVHFEPRRQPGRQTWRDVLMARGARSAFGEIWAVIAETVTTMYPAPEVVTTDPATLNVGRSDRIDRKAGGPVTRVLDPIAAVFGLTDFDIYVSSSSEDIIAPVIGERVALVLGHKVVSSMSAAQRFRLGRTISLLRDRAFVLQVLPRTDLERLIAAAVFRVEPTASLSLPRSEVEPEAQRLYRALPRKARKALPLAVTRFMQEGGELDAWVEGVLTTADRCGLLACGDVMVAMGELQSGGADAAESKPVGPQVAKMLLYSVSTDYLNLRKELQV